MRKIRRKEAGFTLMELMVVIVIVAILAAVAVPLYLNYVRDAQRTEAKGAIGAIITAEQVYYQQNQGAGYTADRAKLNVDLAEIEPSKWGFVITVQGNTGFTVVATQNGVPQEQALSVTYEYDRATPTSKWTP